ncbi:S8 family serine peptidase [Streptomyces pinistramenti]|uniref:S8 family serine peptidase n=1 Tax=Streptomyces pinistramenti TaxID=2884812 RepID=UPI001D05DBF3|nr:S8 family serine peptidase [Streptomyces pinistramenti]MCB5909031.1 S8 family serine peptidase [Streptomyces pinistramenti]
MSDRRRKLSLRATTVGCVLLTGMGTVTAAAAAPLADSAVLPQVTSSLDGTKCVKHSSRTAEATPWPQKLIGIERAHPLSEGSGVAVGVVDGGLDGGVPALAGRVSGAHTDCSGHGTFLAGVVAASHTPGVGFEGVAPRARVIGATVKAEGYGDDADPDSVAAGIRSTVDHGAQVVLVGTGAVRSSDALKSAVAYAQEKNAVVVAGATGSSSRKVAYPAAYPKVVSVAAVDVEGAPLGTGGSTGRAVADGGATARVDLTAPGDRVLSVGPGGGHFTGSGDAVAAAFVAGTAALVRARDPHLSSDAVRERLRATAVRSAGAVPDPVTGYGTVDPEGAVAALPTGDGPGDGKGGRDGAAAYRADPTPAEVTSGPVWAVVGAVAGVAAVVAMLAVLIPRGRARGWRAP